VEALVTLCDSHVITARDVEGQLGLSARSASGASDHQTLPQRLRQFRRNCIIEALAESRGNLSEAARLLGVDRSNLRRDCQDLDIPLG